MASAATATDVNQGSRRSARRLCRRSTRRPSTRPDYLGSRLPAPAAGGFCRREKLAARLAEEHRHKPRGRGGRDQHRPDEGHFAAGWVVRHRQCLLSRPHTPTREPGTKKVPSLPGAPRDLPGRADDSPSGGAGLRGEECAATPRADVQAAQPALHGVPRRARHAAGRRVVLGSLRAALRLAEDVALSGIAAAGGDLHRRSSRADHLAPVHARHGPLPAAASEDALSTRSSASSRRRWRPAFCSWP